jgi:hypothetical protein
LRNITAEDASPIGCSITGLPGHPIEDVLLENIKLHFDGGGTKDLVSRDVPEKEAAYPESTMFGTLPAYGLYCRHADGLTLRHVQLHTRQPDLRHAVVCDDVKQLEIDSVGSGYIEGAAAPLRLMDVDGAIIRRCTAPLAADPFLLLEGKRTRHIVLQQNDTDKAAKAVEFGAGAPEQALSESD